MTGDFLLIFYLKPSKKLILTVSRYPKSDKIIITFRATIENVSIITIYSQYTMANLGNESYYNEEKKGDKAAKRRGHCLTGDPCKRTARNKEL